MPRHDPTQSNSYMDTATEWLDTAKKHPTATAAAAAGAAGAVAAGVYLWTKRNEISSHMRDWADKMQSARIRSRADQDRRPQRIRGDRSIEEDEISFALHDQVVAGDRRAVPQRRSKHECRAGRRRERQPLGPAQATTRGALRGAPLFHCGRAASA